LSVSVRRPEGNLPELYHAAESAQQGKAVPIETRAASAANFSGATAALILQTPPNIQWPLRATPPGRCEKTPDVPTPGFLSRGNQKTHMARGDGVRRRGPRFLLPEL